MAGRRFDLAQSIARLTKTSRRPWKFLGTPAGSPPIDRLIRIKVRRKARDHVLLIAEFVIRR